MGGSIPINASNKKHRIRRSNGIHKYSKLFVLPQGKNLRTDLLRLHPDPLLHPRGIIQRGEPEHHKYNDLQTDTRDDDSVSVLEQCEIRLARAGGQPAADGLEEQAGNIGGDEDGWVERGSDAGEGRVQRQTDVFEG